MVSPTAQGAAVPFGTSVNLGTVCAWPGLDGQACRGHPDAAPAVQPWPVGGQRESDPETGLDGVWSGEERTAPRGGWAGPGRKGGVWAEEMSWAVLTVGTAHAQEDRAGSTGTPEGLPPKAGHQGP